HSFYGFPDIGGLHMNKILLFTFADVNQTISVSLTSKVNTVLQSLLRPGKVFVIPNGVDTAMFRPAPERLNHHEIVIVVISRFVSGRVQICLLESFLKYAICTQRFFSLSEMDQKSASGRDKGKAFSSRSS
ncbi:hypothetical protein GIB67_042449, partial [Kingdonia uniflora]